MRAGASRSSTCRGLGSVQGALLTPHRLPLVSSALNAQAALSQAREHQLASATEPPAGPRPAPQPPGPRPEHCEGAAAGLKAAQGPPPIATPGPPSAVPPLADTAVACTQAALLQKLSWASAELGCSTSVEASVQLCGLIRACAEALHSLKQLQH